MLIRRLAVKISRFIGRRVCAHKGCRYEPPNGCFNSWSAYACVRCDELDRPLDDLPPAPNYYDTDYSPADEYFEFDEEAHNHARRWFQCLPWPRWI